MSHRPASRRACALFALSALVFAQDPAAGSGAKKIGPFTIEKESDRLPVISQDSTGTCWSFGTTSFLESEIKRLHGKDVDLSEMWFARQAIVEKARRAVEGGGKTSFFNERGLTEGGLAHDLPVLMKEYGCVPQAAYTGLLEGKKTHNHGELFKVVAGAIRAMTGAPEGPAPEGAASKPAKAPRPRKPSPQFLAAIGAIADAYMGAPPASFEFEGKTYDPKTFAAEGIKLNPDDYVQVMSYGTSPFGGKAMLDVPDNWLKYDQYENVDVDTFMNLFDSALAQGYTLALDADVSEKGFRTNKAVAEMSEEFEKDPKKITQAMRDEMFKKGETSDDHLMHVVGVAKHEDGRRFYLTKNSWGQKAGPYGGYFFLSEAYMRAKALSVMVHRGALKHKT